MDLRGYTAGLEFEVIRLRELLKKERKKKKRWKKKALWNKAQLIKPDSTLSPKQCFIWLENVLSEEAKQTNEFADIRMYLLSFEQILWEKDMAIDQLHELGYELGQKVKDEDTKH